MSYNALPPNIRAIAETHLTPKQHRIFKLKTDGHSNRTIAAALQQDEATIRGHYKRALKRIRQHTQEKAA